MAKFGINGLVPSVSADIILVTELFSALTASCRSTGAPIVGRESNIWTKKKRKRFAYDDGVWGTVVGYWVI
jgi:hypothetical protein